MLCEAIVCYVEASLLKPEGLQFSSGRGGSVCGCLKKAQVSKLSRSESFGDTRFKRCSLLKASEDKPRSRHGEVSWRLWQLPLGRLSTVGMVLVLRKPWISKGFKEGGTQIRTGGKGFAILCLTTWPCRRLGANSQ